MTFLPESTNVVGAQYGRFADGVVVSKPGLWIPFNEKHYAVRLVDNRFVLWDKDTDQLVG